MVARILAAIFLLISGLPAYAACTNLYQSHVVNLQTNVPLPGASVTVYLYGTTTKATIYDLNCNAISNPMIADSNALATFKSDGTAQYQVQWQQGSYVSPGYFYFPSTYTPPASPSSSTVGFYATGPYSSGFTDGLYLDYSSPYGRFTTGPADGFKWFSGASPGTGLVMTLDVDGSLSPIGTIKPPAGTATVAPIRLSAGTNLTTAVAGSIEYDGKVGYFTPQSTQRGVVPGAQTYFVNTGYVGSNSNSAQTLFNVGVTLSSNTVYRFRYHATLNKSAGTTSHQIGALFVGTATLNSINYWITGFNTQASVYGASSTATLFNFTGAMTQAANLLDWWCEGVVSVNVGGTFIPQYQATAVPGGAYTTSIGSFMEIFPIGAAGSNISVGVWQ